MVKRKRRSKINQGVADNLKFLTGNGMTHAAAARALGISDSTAHHLKRHNYDYSVYSNWMRENKQESRQKMMTRVELLRNSNDPDSQRELLVLHCRNLLKEVTAILVELTKEPVDMTVSK